ncbi:hypothetical protein WA1_09890 [Scytonema hofmannii PCC 7110]|uniref:DUF4340 domain-containing protein n=1 Tax=Scytonema hofmannii PCC 7110 TaxID=128403 RepID=A0A139WRH7_9CYAN|nr:DUF4340 domain-containing protein [Scytonema hofmannii]KYC35038.1 hypothetical protein WA1_09890 [Scytonema hofmannii PCC 7110]
MKLQRTTLILLLIALGLGGFVYFYEIRGSFQREEVKENKQPIFSFKEDEVQSLTIQTQNQTINLERSGKSEGTKWLMKSPSVVPASDPIVGYLMNLLVEGKSDRTISISTNQLSEFGLAQPQATIDIKLKNQQNHQLILGQTDFNRRFLYAQVNPSAQPKGNINVLLVSTDFENAVKRDLSEWKQAPDNSNKQPTPSVQPSSTKKK